MNKTSDQDKVAQIIDAVMKVAAGDFSVQIEVSEKHDHLDALALGINMMIDDLRNKYITDLDNETIKKLNIELEYAKSKSEESERRYRSLSDASFEAIFISEKGVCIDQNKTAELLFGYTLSEAIGKPGTDWIFPADRELVINNILSGYEKPYIANALTKKGTTFPCEIQASITNYKGKEVRITALRDITEKKLYEQEIIKAKEKVEKNEAKFNELSNLTFEGIVLHQNGIAVDINLSFAQIFGYTREEVIGKSVIKLIAKEEYHNIISQNIIKNYALPYEIVGIRKDGTEIPLEVEARDVDLDDKSIRLAAVRIISERKKFEKELQKQNKELLISKEKAEGNERQLNAILENSPTGFAINRISTGEVTYVNKAFIDAYCIPIELCSTVSGFFEYVYGNQLDLGNKILEDIKSGIPERLKWDVIPITNKKTKNIHYITAANIILKELDLMISTVIDITSQINNEKELKFSKEKAEESDRLKSAFLATMSHELRTPLNAVIGFSDLLCIRLTEEENKDYAELILSSGQHLLSIVDDLFDIVLIESGESKINETEFDINTIINEISQIIEHEKTRIKKEHLKINIINPNINGLIIKSDKLKLKQILVNLLRNAIKFTDNGVIDFGYVLVENTSGTMIEFFVKDCGIGISEEKQKIIFDSFKQVEDSNTRKFGGIGIGLSIAKKLTALLGGEIWVKSKIGVGSEFRFSITHNKAINIVNDSKSKESPDNNDRLKGMKILIAEDDHDSHFFLDVVLQENSMQTLWADNGKSAVEYCKDNPDIDLVLMDINLPIMNGYEATSEIKKIRPELPIIAQTAFAIAGDKEKALSIGCDDYISKPIKKDKLMGLIMKYLK